MMKILMSLEICSAHTNRQKSMYFLVAVALAKSDNASTSYSNYFQCYECKTVFRTFPHKENQRHQPQRKVKRIPTQKDETKQNLRQSLESLYFGNYNWKVARKSLVRMWFLYFMIFPRSQMLIVFETMAALFGKVLRVSGLCSCKLLEQFYQHDIRRNVCFGTRRKIVNTQLYELGSVKFGWEHHKTKSKRKVVMRLTSVPLRSK